MNIDEIRKLHVEIRDTAALKRIPLDALKSHVEIVGGWRIHSTYENRVMYVHKDTMPLLDQIYEENPDGKYVIILPKSVKDPDYAEMMQNIMMTLEKTDPQSRTQIELYEALVTK